LLPNTQFHLGRNLGIHSIFQRSQRLAKAQKPVGIGFPRVLQGSGKPLSALRLGYTSETLAVAAPTRVRSFRLS
jgi:hypothetical protein